MTDSWTKRTDGSTTWSARSGNVSGPVTWTQATRPTAGLFDGMTGRNSDFDGLEEYVLSQGKWRILSGTWTTATRPLTANIVVGSQGDNTDSGMGRDRWNGSTWETL